MLIPPRLVVQPDTRDRHTISAASIVCSGLTPIPKNILLPSRNFRGYRSAASLQRHQNLRRSNHPGRELLPTSAPWILRSAKQSPEPAQNAAWRSSRKQLNTPAPCTRRLFATTREVARFVAWPWNRVSPQASTLKTTQNCAACSGVSGLESLSAFHCLRSPWEAWLLAVRCITCRQAGWNGCN